MKKGELLEKWMLLISLKINKTSGNQKEFGDEQKIIDKYLTLIEKYRDIINETS